jgi:hypothetical protein
MSEVVSALSPSTEEETTSRRSVCKNVCWSPQYRTLLVAAVYSVGCITVFEIAGGTELAIVKNRFWPEPGKRPFDFRDVCIDLAGSRLAAFHSPENCEDGYDDGEDEGKLYMWNLNTAELLFVLTDIMFFGKLSFSKNGHVLAFMAGVGHEYSTFVVVLDASKGNEICRIFSDVDHEIVGYIFNDGDCRILTVNNWQGPVRCWCAFSGQRINGHWTESHLAYVVSANFSGDLLLLVSAAPYELRVVSADYETFTCFTAEGELLSTYNVRFGRVATNVPYFVDEYTVAYVETWYPGPPRIVLLDSRTGMLSNEAVEVYLAYDNEYVRNWVAGNGAKKMIIGRLSDVNICTTHEGVIGDITVVMEDPQIPTDSSVVTVCGVELDSVILM